MSFISTIIMIWLMIIAFKRSESISCNLPQAQYDALELIYDESAGEEWDVPRHDTKWSFPSAVNAPCEDNWTGVTCVCVNLNKQYDITSLSLSKYNMQGRISMSIGNLSSLQNIDFSSNNLQGEIPISTYRLPFLTSLYLYSNMLTGSISSEIVQLTSLMNLDLFSNILTGSIPSEIGQLSQLVYLYLYRNVLTGSIPSEIGQLSSLQKLSLYSNMLTGTIPPYIGHLSSLTFLGLDSNILNGSIPSEMGQLSSLQELNLYSNMLTGSIPSDIGHLSSLVDLYLYFNLLNGPVPAEIEQLSSLANLVVYSNMLTGSIPSEIGKLSSITKLDLSSNILTGTIPSEIGQLSLLHEFDLDFNMLTGSIPSEIGQISSLVVLGLVTNLLTGSIPSSLGNLSSLVFLDLDSNMLTGTIPSTIGQLLLLNELYLLSNRLTGAIPSDIGQLLSLVYLGLDFNMLTGSIPSEIGQLTSLGYLDLDSNMFTGFIPSEIGQLSELVYLGLNSNMLSGFIPSEIGLLSLLSELYLYSNMLTGTIPSSLGKLSMLEQVDLNSNHITGAIPFDIGNAISLSGLYLYSNNLVGSIPSSFSNLKLLQSLYLFNNSLTSSIPTSLGNLSLLQNLFLQSNKISLTIPVDFGNLKNLKVICLDDNIISGTFPSGMKALSLLTQISLSNNLLNGNIFSSFVTNQFTVFNVANNAFTGSLTNNNFDLSTSLSTIIASGNCFTGSIPDNVCNVMHILTIFDFSNSGGNSLCLENQHVQSLRPSFVHGTFSQLGLSGTIPSCLLHSSTMTALKLSGNKLEGTISSNPTNMSTSLLKLTLANNALTGSIPTWVQLHSFLELDLSNNRLDGTLSTDFIIASDQIILGLAVNRLSGPLPHSIVSTSANMSSLNVLAGNIFDCNNNDLPALDPSSASYTCGSYDLNISAYTWLVCVGFFVVAMMIVAAKFWHPIFLDLSVSVGKIIDTLKLWQAKTFMQVNLSRIGNIDSKHHNTSRNLPEVILFILLSRFITIAVLFIVSMALLNALPLFVGLHTYYAIVSFDYGYLLSIAYLHGIAPVVAVSCLLAAILIVAAMFVPALIEYITRLRTGKQTMEEISLPTLPLTTLMKKSHWNTLRSYMIFAFLNLINIVVVMSVNISYIATFAHRVKYNRVELLVIQVSVGLFKVVWNTFYVAWSCDWLASFFTHRSSMRSRYMMSIINYIIAPVLSTIVYNESCFYYVFNNGVQSVSSSVLVVTNHEICNTIDCFQTISINIDSKSSSSFVYSYACGSALIVAYTPVFFSSALFYGLFQQFIRLFLAFDNPSRIVYGIKELPKLLFARILKPSTGIKDVPLAESGIRVKGRDIIVRLMVHMTIMLTFGLASPILIIPLAFAVIMDCKVSQLLVGKCIHENDTLHAINSDTVKQKGVDLNTTGIDENQPHIPDTLDKIPNTDMSGLPSTIKADLLIMEHLDTQSSWQGLDVCIYPMIMFVILFWALLFFDMIADGYGVINGIIIMTCFATLPSIFSIVIIKSKAMTHIISYFGLAGAIERCINKMSTDFLDINALKRPADSNMDVKSSVREVGDAQGDIQLNPINHLPVISTT